MNQVESERLAAVMEGKGYKLAKKIEEADLVIINTCSVRESAENRVFGLIRNLTNNSPQKKAYARFGGEAKKRKIILTGCMVGSATGDRRRYSLKTLKQRLPGVDEFKTINELIGQTKVSPKRLIGRPAGKRHAFVPIMSGCNHFCTYCVVPYARGKEISRPFKEIIKEVECLAQQSYQHITLLGQNVNSYQPSFAKLLKRLHEIKGLKKISFLTSNPWDLTDEIIEAMRLPKIDRQLHLPVQSGDNKILKKMNRPYTVLQYIKLVEKIRKKIPEIKISTDIIVGFPGETEKAFENTVKLCQEVGFSKAYLAKYSPRPGTAAYKMKDKVPPQEKKRRWQVLEKLINQ